VAVQVQQQVLQMVHKERIHFLALSHQQAAVAAAKVTTPLDQTQAVRVVLAEAVAAAELKQAVRAIKEVILQLKVTQAVLQCLAILHQQVQAEAAVDRQQSVLTHQARQEMLEQAVMEQPIQ
jgi:hypothetical protein